MTRRSLPQSVSMTRSHATIEAPPGPRAEHEGHRRAARRDGTHVRRHRSKRFVSLLVTALVLNLGLLGGTAYAYFLASGSGTGQASVAALSPVLVEHATVVPGALFPGGTAGLSLKLKNPNAVPLTLVGVSEVGTTVTVTPATTIGCTGATAGVSVSAAVASGLSDTLRASTTATGVTTLTIPTGATMSTSSASACQTKSFHIKVTVTVRT